MTGRFGGAIGALMVIVALSLAGPETFAATDEPGPGQAPAPSTQTMFRPVAVVNDSAITGYDLAQRAQLLAALGFPVASPEALKEEALNRLVDDRLKLQEAKRFGITPDPEEVAKGIERMAGQANMSADEFIAMLGQRGITRQALEDMIGAETAWRQLVRDRFLRRIEPGEAEIDFEIALLQERAGVSYRLAEVGLPFSAANGSAEDLRRLAEDIRRRLAEGADFQAMVRKYSRAPSAARGGEIGWVAGAQLPPDIVDALEGLETGGITEPIEVPGGFSILKVLDKRVENANAIDTTDPKLREEIRKRLIQRQTLRLAEGLLQELRRDAVIEIR